MSVAHYACTWLLRIHDKISVAGLTNQARDEKTRLLILLFGYGLRPWPCCGGAVASFSLTDMNVAPNAW